MKKFINVMVCASILLASVGALRLTAYAESSTEDASKMQVFSIKDGVTESYTGARQSYALTEGRYDFGYWVRGVTFGWRSYVISRYKSNGNQGHASVVNGQGLYRAGGWKPAGTFSSAELVATWSGNKAYYNWK